MSRVPRIRFKGFEEDWEQRKLGEVIQERNIRTSDFDKFPIFSLTIESGVTPKTERYERSSLVTKTEDLFKVVKPNEFVTNPMNLRFGALGYNTQKYDISVSGYYDVFSIDGNNCSGFWNAYFKTQQVMNIFDNVATGSLVEKKRVKYSTLKQIYVSVPSAIEEKNKISKFMSFTDHLITLHQRKLEKLKIIKKSMLENLFPQNGEKTPKIRFSGFTKDWEQRKLGEVANRFDSTRIPISENLRVSGKTPYYGANGIQDYVDGYTHDGEYVLIAEDGANDLKNYPIRLVKGRIWVNNHAHVIQGMEKFMNNQFINFAMSQVDFESIVVGCGRAKLNAEQLMDICFKIPNKNEQANIGRLFESINHLITLHQSKLEKLQKIKKSMLESMFV